MSTITVTEYFGQHWISEGKAVIAMCTRPEVAERIRRALAPTPSLQGVDTREAVAKELCRFSAEVSETWETTTHKDLYYGEADKILSLIRPQTSEPIGRLRVADQEKGWDGMPVRVLVTNGEKNEWYFCKGHPMAHPPVTGREEAK